MKPGHLIILTLAAIIFSFTTAISPNHASAHCDTLDGPVVGTARAALADGDITPILKWVQPSDEQQIKNAFRKTLEVRALGDEARELADMYFFETLVRLHRAGEGAPYTGLKPGESVDPAVALADKALAGGSVDKLVEILNNAMANGIRTRFAEAYAKQKHADANVARCREFVESYVVFTHYVEGLHGLIKGGDAHGDDDEGH
jgi:hypothetical protein